MAWYNPGSWFSTDAHSTTVFKENKESWGPNGPPRSKEFAEKRAKWEADNADRLITREDGTKVIDPAKYNANEGPERKSTAELKADSEYANKETERVTGNLKNAEYGMTTALKAGTATAVTIGTGGNVAAGIGAAVALDTAISAGADQAGLGQIEGTNAVVFRAGKSGAQYASGNEKGAAETWSSISKADVAGAALDLVPVPGGSGTVGGSVLKEALVEGTKEAASAYAKDELVKRVLPTSPDEAVAKTPKAAAPSLTPEQYIAAPDAVAKNNPTSVDPVPMPNVEGKGNNPPSVTMPDVAVAKGGGVPPVPMPDVVKKKTPEDVIATAPDKDIPKFVAGKPAQKALDNAQEMLKAFVKLAEEQLGSNNNTIIKGATKEMGDIVAAKDSGKFDGLKGQKTPSNLMSAGGSTGNSDMDQLVGMLVSAMTTIIGGRDELGIGTGLARGGQDQNLNLIINPDNVKNAEIMAAGGRNNGATVNMPAPVGGDFGKIAKMAASGGIEMEGNVRKLAESLKEKFDGLSDENKNTIGTIKGNIEKLGGVTIAMADNTAKVSKAVESAMPLPGRSGGIA